MEILIEERKDEGFVLGEKRICIYINNLASAEYENIIDYLNNHLVEDLITNDKFLNNLEISIEARRDIYNYVSGKIDYAELKKKFEERDLSYVVTILSISIRKYCELYKKIKDNIEIINRVVINCNENNILRALKMAESVKDKPTILNCGNMTIIDFYNVIKDINIEEYIDSNIEVYFKGYSSSTDLYRSYLIGKHLMKEVLQAVKICEEIKDIPYKNGENKPVFGLDNFDDEIETQESGKLKQVQDPITPSFSPSRLKKKKKIIN